MPTAEPYTLRLIFDGLCAFVPNKKIEKGVKDLKVKVLLPNADRNCVHGGHECVRHLPALTFNVADLANATGQADPITGWWPLENLDLRIELSQADEYASALGVIPEIGGVTPGTELPQAHEIEDLYWLAQIASAAPGAADVHPDCLAQSSDYPPVSVYLTTRVHLIRGRLFALDVGRFLKRPMSAQLVPALGTGRPWPQAFASQIALDISELKHPVSIIGERLRETDVAKEGKVILKGKPGHRVEVKITNLCPEPHVKLVHGEELTTRAPRPDSDFAWYYQLSKNRPGEEIRPVPVPVHYAPKATASGGAGGGDPVRCTGTLFLPAAF